MQMEKCRHLSQAFSFFAKGGVGQRIEELDLREIGLFNIGKYFQYTPRIENSVAIPGFSI